MALPVFAGEFLMAVVVLLCGDDAKHVGAIELWHNDPERSHEMGLVDGYYGTADMFEFNSRHTRFPRGFGLPGRTWKADRPLIVADLHNAKRFLRWEDASEIGINCGIGIPYKSSGDETWVVTLLSAQATPIAQRFEIWVPDATRQTLIFEAGSCSTGANLDALYGSAQIRKGEGAIGGAWFTGIPGISGDLKKDTLDRGAGRAKGRLESGDRTSDRRRRDAQGGHVLVSVRCERRHRASGRQPPPQRGDELRFDRLQIDRCLVAQPLR